MNPPSWRALVLYSLPLIAYLQVTAGRQLIMENMTNPNNEWIGWCEVNSIDGDYWVVHNDSASFDGVVLLNTSNTSMSCSSCAASGSGVADPQYTLLSSVYDITTNNCNSTISYTLRVDVIVEVIVISSNNNISVANLSGTVDERQTQSLILDQSAMQLIFSVTTNLNDELLSIDDVNFSDNCFDSVSPTSTIPMMIDLSTDFDMTTDILASSDGMTASRMVSTSSSHVSLPASSSMMITSITPSVLVSSTEEISTFMNTTISTPVNMPSSILPTTTISTSINTLDILSITSPMLQSTTSSLSASVSDISSTSMLNTTIMSMSSSSSSSSLIDAFTESSLFFVTATESSLPSVTTTAIMPSSSNASASDDETFFTTNVIIGISAGGTFLIILCLLVTCCCLCYRARISRRNKHQYFINNNTSHKGHSSVYAQQRYRNKSRSVESMSSPYHYELPFVHIETAPEAYTHSANGDDDTIDSESEDIRHDLKGTPTSSRHGSLSIANEQPTKMTSFYPQKEEPQWSDYDDGDSNKDETNSDIVYTNRNLVDEMCGAELPPILSLGDYEDDDNVVIVNPYKYNPTFYSESNPVPSKDESPRRHTTTKSNINLEALTTLESSGEYYTPKQSIPNYRRKQAPRSSAVGKNNNKVLRKAKSEINLEDATKIRGASRYPRHPNKSRIDLKEATKLGHSHSDGYQYNKRTHHSSTPRILDSSSSKLERLTSLNTT